MRANRINAMVFFFVFLFTSIPFASAIEKGEKYINFKLKDMKGESIELASFEGKVIFLDVWASWCPPCSKELPFLMDVYEKYKERGFVVVAVSVDDKERNVTKFFKRIGREPTFPVIYDPQKSVRHVYDLVGIPSSLIIGKDGKIAYEPRTGFEESHAEEITKQIEEALSKK